MQREGSAVAMIVDTDTDSPGTNEDDSTGRTIKMSTLGEHFSNKARVLTQLMSLLLAFGIIGFVQPATRAWIAGLDTTFIDLANDDVWRPETPKTQVNFHLVWAVSYLVPIALIVLIECVQRHGNVKCSGSTWQYDAFMLCYGLVICNVLTQIWTEMAKAAFAVPRRLFMAECDPDPAVLQEAKEAMASQFQVFVLAATLCRNSDASTKGRLSFPSGHTSQSTAFGVFLCLYLCHKLRLLNRETVAPPFWAVLASVSPLVFGLFIGGGKVLEHKHRLHEVLLGAALAAFCAVIAWKMVPKQAKRFDVNRRVSPDWGV
ncbi:MAG: hypothetical protein MHM6MM_005398 [Cercozoa sp. M6MM]